MTPSSSLSSSLQPHLLPPFLDHLHRDTDVETDAGGVSTLHSLLLPIYVPPLNFATVQPGTVYRSGFPRLQNYAFLETLGLKGVMYLADQDFRADTLNWAEGRGLKVKHLRIESNKEPLVEASMKDMEDALLFAKDPENLPLLVFCNRGRHRVGLFSALLRREEGWSLSVVFEEYRRFFSPVEGADRIGGGEGSGGKAGRVGDLEWIEAFDLSGMQDGEELARMHGGG